jgi:hypothetical protein
MNRLPPKVVVQSTALRDALIGGVIAVLVLGFVAYGIFHMGQPVQGNKITGIIVEKQFIPLKEKQIEFSGRNIKSVKESDGEYILKVRVEAEQGRVFEVPVAKSLYDLKGAGDKLTFIRPPSEQR